LKPHINIFWFRRDLRLADNVGLFYALKSGLPVLPIFIFDKNILDKLEDKSDRRVEFIHAALEDLHKALIVVGASMNVFYGSPENIYEKLLEQYQVDTVFTNHDYEPYAMKRDETIASLLLKNGTTFETFKDQVVFEKSEVVKDDGKPYTVFTPYSRKWKSRLTQNDLQECNTQQYVQNFLKQPEQPLPSIESIGFVKTGLAFPSKIVQNDIIKHYTENRNFPGIANSTSKMGVHLRFGTISIRQLAKVAQQLNETYLNELIWRDFYHAILWHFPKVGMGQSFKSDYDRIQWRNNEVEFARWCDGNTGYPIVDAGMRELNATGFMHNRVRMIVASFLTKHLLIDWRWGEAYFAQKLLDFDLAANNGGWQWASGSGCDAAPYFRVFNPYLQTEKFDKSLTYIKKWVPEFQELTYAQPIIIHEVARKRVLETYAKALKGE
jgi:deoxyribodipyrimidine photo-lyase